MAKKQAKKILIVEDDINFVSILKEKFEQSGFLVITAQDGKDGLHAAVQESPDLIVSDILLPQLNGLDMIKKIRAKKSGLPVIFLTNVKDQGYEEELKKIKKSDYVIKCDVRLDDIVKIANKRLKAK